MKVENDVKTCKIVIIFSLSSKLENTALLCPQKTNKLTLGWLLAGVGGIFSLLMPQIIKTHDINIRSAFPHIH